MEIVHFSYSVGAPPTPDLFAGLPDIPFKQKVHALARYMRDLEQTPLPVKHHFSPGLYMREIFMPAGTIVIGKIHKTEHFNILVSGACLIVHDDDHREELRAPMVFVSKPGVQKVLYITEDMTWMTTHVTHETDLKKLEALLIEPMPFAPSKEFS
jgi:hypothetical protein